jgi:putative DNA primase/helicase
VTAADRHNLSIDEQAARDLRLVEGMSRKPTAAVIAKVDLRRAADVPMTAIRWLWDGFLAKGKLHVFGGPPGSGKTTVALSMAATVTCGGRWPDGSLAKAGNVLIWSGEDDEADTLIPRLAAAGADLKRCYFVGDTRKGADVRAFDPAQDIVLLTAEAERIGGVSLILVDPIVSAVSGDSHKNTETRRALQPLVEMAERLDAAVLGITHFSKGSAGRDPTERITGSIAFGAVARVVMVAAKRAEGEDGPARMIARAKSNIGPDGGGFGYDLAMVDVGNGIEASTVRWGAPLTGTARELLGAAEAVDGNPRDEGAEWLRDMLSDGPMKVKELRTEVNGSGASWRTIEAAKTELGVIAERHSAGNAGGGFWTWRLPGKSATATPQPSPQNLAVLPEASTGAGFTGCNTARPQHRNGGSLAADEGVTL